MATRLSRWVGLGLALALLPVVLAYGVRWYYLERPPSAVDLLGGGDALLIAVAWSATALLEVVPARTSAALRTGTATAALFVLVTSSVAYGCRTADSVTGRVQTPAQARFVTSASLWALALGAAVSTAAAALSPAGREESG